MRSQPWQAGSACLNHLRATENGHGGCQKKENVCDKAQIDIPSRQAHCHIRFTTFSSGFVILWRVRRTENAQDSGCNRNDDFDNHLPVCVFHNGKF